MCSWLNWWCWWVLGYNCVILLNVEGISYSLLKLKVDINSATHFIWYVFLKAIIWNHVLKADLSGVLIILATTLPNNYKIFKVQSILGGKKHLFTGHFLTFCSQNKQKCVLGWNTLNDFLPQTMFLELWQNLFFVLYLSQLAMLIK